MNYHANHPPYIINKQPTRMLFNIPVMDLDYEYLNEKINNAVKTRNKIIINYLNANIVRLVGYNKNLKKSILSADIVHPDGVGIWFSSKLLKTEKLKNRFNFTDCSKLFLQDCQLKGWSIFILGSKNKTLNKAVRYIHTQFPGLYVAGTLNGYNEAAREDVVKLINDRSPDILWVGMGTPKQELWIYKNKDKLNCSVIQAVGDLITHIAGEKTRGPVFIQKLGLEWTARLIRHPVKYFNRYIIGIPVFILIVLKEIMITRKSS